MNTTPADPAEDPHQTSTPSAADQRPSFGRRFGYLLRQLFRPDEVDDELRALVENREEADEPLTPEEKTLVAAALSFSNKTADDVCVPRADMVAMSVDATLDEVVEHFRHSGHSRLPVFRDNLDDIIGFITIKDLLQFWGNGAKDFKLNELLRPCTFVPDTLAVPKVLEEMRKARVQMAVVVDEYGGSAGLVTLKDIIETLVGEMEDEHETAAPLMIVPLPGNRYELDPRLPIEELEERLHASFELPAEDHDFDEDGERPFETVGGFLLSIARRVPAPGETFTTPDGFIFKVIDSDGRRLYKIELQLPKRRTLAHG